ncbi:hypothetical protein D5085_13145 [Ectothiorhodospiraceae bacterium BW-2]|nr:hypothetical protein D5085_13145 [Ectothiorhodospiraceae bacterium BW-2]
MNIHTDLSDLIGLYLRAGSTLLQRLAASIVDGFHQIFTVDDELKYNYFRDRGIGHARGRRYRQAAEVLIQLYRVRPDDSEMATYLGVSLLKVGEGQQGVEILQRIRQQQQQGEDLKRINTILLAAYQQLDERENYLMLLMEQVKGEPQKLEHYLTLAEGYCYYEAWVQAISVYEKALILDKDHIATHEGLLRCYQALEDHDAEQRQQQKLSQLRGEGAVASKEEAEPPLSQPNDKILRELQHLQLTPRAVETETVVR